ncbi:hypothetical protein [Xylocopilactobacillus apicola]|uniref:Uncharacterized protein n=1 Tax=Xylocopilactobacillus apicola TaxID=2932184 RepID=A0AAU9DYW4_9LACO|nr:hypothetical protein [Xylocopilactobacillus apicola]BDR59403.1 hypothetical protein XA3_18440 [Xylocopilactobacillus apicola]
MANNYKRTNLKAVNDLVLIDQKLALVTQKFASVSTTLSDQLNKIDSDLL